VATVWSCISEQQRRVHATVNSVHSQSLKWLDQRRLRSHDGPELKQCEFERSRRRSVPGSFLSSSQVETKSLNRAHRAAAPCHLDRQLRERAQMDPDVAKPAPLLARVHNQARTCVRTCTFACRLIHLGAVLRRSIPGLRTRSVTHVMHGANLT